MRCTCGYDFATAALASLRDGSERYESYAVIRDNDYEKVVKLDYAALNASDDADRSRRIARSAQLVGTAKVCPDCSRLVFIGPRTGELVRYRREDE